MAQCGSKIPIVVSTIYAAMAAKVLHLKLSVRWQHQHDIYLVFLGIGSSKRINYFVLARSSLIVSLFLAASSSFVHSNGTSILDVSEMGWC